MVTCEICHELLQDLSSHLRWRHGVDTTEYLRRYPGSILVDSGLAKTRSEHRDAKEATAKTAITWAGKYEGGHPMRDPKVLQSHMVAREVNGGRYDHEAAKSTSQDRYGVDFHSQTEEHRSASRKTMSRLIADGTIKKPEKVPCPCPDTLKELCALRTPYSKMCKELGCSDYLLKSWMKQLSISVVDSRLVRDADGKEVDPLTAMQAIHAKYGKLSREFVRKLPKEEFPFHYSTMEKKYGSWNGYIEAAGFTPSRYILTPLQHMEPYLRECLRLGKLISVRGYGAHHGGGEHSSAIYSLLNGKLSPLKDELATFFPSEQWVSAFLAKVETMI